MASKFYEFAAGFGLKLLRLAAEDDKPKFNERMAAQCGLSVATIRDWRTYCGSVGEEILEALKEVDYLDNRSTITLLYIDADDYEGRIKLLAEMVEKHNRKKRYGRRTYRTPNHYRKRARANV